MSSRPLIRFASAAALCVAFACAPTLATLDAPCPLTGQCPSGLACIEGACRAPCSGDEDCAEGKKCAPFSGGSWCSTTCTRNADCPIGVCVSGTGVCGDLPSSCSMDADCPVGAACCDQECIDLQTDPLNCGTCGHSCGEGSLCANGTCGCQDGYTACGAGAGQGCFDLQMSAAHCGSCGVACLPGGVCTDGSCSCPAGRLPCDSACADVSSDAQNCGACGVVCGPGQVCSNGSCQCPPENLCGGVCRDLSHDPENCGACGHSCRGNVCGPSGCEAKTLVELTSGKLAQFSVDGGYVYWADPVARTVNRQPVAGGSVEVIAQDQEGVEALATLGSNVYWGFHTASGGGIRRGVKTGGGVVDLVSGGTYHPRRIFLYGSALFFGSDDDGGETHIYETTTGGGTPAWRLVTVDPTRFAVNSTFIFVGGVSGGNDQGLFRWNRQTSGEPEQIESTSGLDGVTVYSEQPFWSRGTEIRTQSGNGSPAVAFSGTREMTDLFVDGQFFYWSEDGVRVVRQPR